MDANAGTTLSNDSKRHAAWVPSWAVASGITYLVAWPALHGICQISDDNVKLVWPVAQRGARVVIYQLQTWVGKGLAVGIQVGAAEVTHHLRG